MKAFLIDPTEKTVAEVEYDGNYKSIYTLIDCDVFDVVRVDEANNAIFVDDEGLLTHPEGPFFSWAGYPQPISGKGLVLGTDDEGGSIAPTLTLDQVRASVSFEQPAFPPEPGFAVFSF